MNYRSFADLSRDIKANLSKIPNDVSLVVGIPRSGLLAANLISVYLNLPLTDIDSFINSRILSPCLQSPKVNESVFNGSILVVDDSVATGKAILDAKQKLQPLIDGGKFKFLFCCVYAEPLRKNMVDIALALLERPRLFEWNLFHNSIMTKACVELDGVLCSDDCEKAPGDAKEAESYLIGLQPTFVPKTKIRYIVTRRPEKYRHLIETWLQENGIRYDKLLMYDPAKGGEVYLFKAAAYRSLKDAELFLESDPLQAKMIFEHTGKDVYSLEENRLLSKQNYTKVAQQFKRKSAYFIQHVKKALSK